MLTHEQVSSDAGNRDRRRSSFLERHFEQRGRDSNGAKAAASIVNAIATSVTDKNIDRKSLGSKEKRVQSFERSSL